MTVSAPRRALRSAFSLLVAVAWISLLSRFAPDAISAGGEPPTVVQGHHLVTPAAAKNDPTSARGQLSGEPWVAVACPAGAHVLSPSVLCSDDVDHLVSLWVGGPAEPWLPRGPPYPS